MTTTFFGDAASQNAYTADTYIIADGTEGFHTFLTGETLTQQVYTLIHKRILFFLSSRLLLSNRPTFLLVFPNAAGSGLLRGFRRNICVHLCILFIL